MRGNTGETKVLLEQCPSLHYHKLCFLLRNRFNWRNDKKTGDLNEDTFSALFTDCGNTKVRTLVRKSKYMRCYNSFVRTGLSLIRGHPVAHFVEIAEDHETLHRNEQAWPSALASTKEH
jgi:hypothetical protein